MYIFLSFQFHLLSKTCKSMMLAYDRDKKIRKSMH